MASRQPKPIPSCYYQLRVSLRYLKPEIWRRLLVSDIATLAQLHHLLQIVMGWTNSHMHEFRIAKARYGTPNPGWSDMNQTLNEKRYTLATAVGDKLRKFDYLYDFGDGWEHEVRIEKRLTSTEMPSRSQCTAGANACPPDDVGGVPGYCDFVAAVLDPKHPEHRELLQWYGGHFDPYLFDIDRINTQLKRIRI
ncbi:MAG TPA: plasmid pRiA4b ORF-3 family protein [Terriglobales bacterium]